MSNIIYHPVTSSNIHAVAYENGIGYVEFNGGRRFAYEMPRALFDQMLAAKSVGSFFAKNIKGVCKAIWRGCRCDLSPCENDATMTGNVAGQKFSVCEDHGRDARFSNVELVELSGRPE